jgi:hypothetical protein
MDYIRMNIFYQSHMSGRWPKPWKENAEHIPQFADVKCDGLITRRNQLEVKTQNKENNTPGKGKGKGRGRGKKVQDGKNEHEDGPASEGQGSEEEGKGEGEHDEKGEKAVPAPKVKQTGAKTKARGKAKASAKSSSSRPTQKRAVEDDDDTVPPSTANDPKDDAPPPAPKRAARKTRNQANGDAEGDADAAMEPAPKKRRSSKPDTPVPKAVSRKRKVKGAEEQREAGESGEGEVSTVGVDGGEGSAKRPRARGGPRSAQPTSDLPDPESWRAEAKEKVLQTLKDCKECGTLGRKEKHDHNHVLIDVQGDLSNSIHWKASRAGTRLKEGNKAGTQICFFSRETPCNGTNVALVAIWALWLQDQCNAMLFERV